MDMIRSIFVYELSVYLLDRKRWPCHEIKRFGLACVLKLFFIIKLCFEFQRLYISFSWYAK